MKRRHLLVSLAKSQSGQALTEFLVVALALVPLFLLIPVIAKVQDIRHATEIASRYVAFEATQRNDAASTFKPETQLAAEVRQRFFSRPEAAIKTGEVALDTQAQKNLFWRDPNDKPLIAKFSDVALSFGETRGASHAEAFKNASDAQPFLLASQAGLSGRGIYRANVSVPLISWPAGVKSYEPFDALQLRITRHTSVVIDPWAANAASQAEQRFGRLAPIDAGLAALEPLLDIAVLGLERLGSVEPPRFGRLEAWRDVVPRDRLAPAVP